MEQMQSTIGHYSRRIPEPATVRLLCDSQRKLGREIDTFVRKVQPHNRRPRRICDCLASGGFFSVITHQEGCPDFFPYNQVKTIQSRYQLCNRFLQYTVFASLRITTGAGGFAICPNLTFRAKVALPPAFDLVDEAWRSEDFYKRAPEDLKDLRVKILRLFREGKASPTDVDVYGRSLFHELALLVGFMVSVGEEGLVEASQLLVGLSSPRDLSALVDDYGMTVADELACGLSLASHHKATMKDEIRLPGVWIESLSIIMDDGCFIKYDMWDKLAQANNKPWTETEFFRFRWFQHLVNSASNWDIHIPSAFEPVMLQDGSLLRSLLTDSSSSVFATVPNPYILWPEGLRILLQSGKRVHRYHLQEACTLHLMESTTLLVSARQFYIDASILCSAVQTENVEIIKLIVDALVEERRELQSLVEQNLTSAELASLQLRPESLLGYRAHTAHEFLQASRLELRECFDRDVDEPWLVYASTGESCEMADLLWHGGFQDVDDTDFGGRTSLMFCQDLSFAD